MSTRSDWESPGFAVPPRGLLPKEVWADVIAGLVTSRPCRRCRRRVPVIHSRQEVDVCPHCGARLIVVVGSV